MRSDGTKATQGINGDAAALGRREDAAAKLTAGPLSPCAYPPHRPTDWRLDEPGSPRVCGICHPPPTDEDGSPLFPIRRRPPSAAA